MRNVHGRLVHLQAGRAQTSWLGKLPCRKGAASASDHESSHFPEATRPARARRFTTPVDITATRPAVDNCKQERRYNDMYTNDLGFKTELLDI